MSEIYRPMLSVACDAARAGGAELLRWCGRFEVREKGRSDLVTEADLASQSIIRDRLLSAFPDHGFLAEEEGGSRNGTSDLRWIVDPLDGTTNYVHGLAQFSVSIALEERGRPIIGVVYDPVADECFAAAAGLGATLNDRPMRVSGVQNLAQALVAASFPPSVDRNHVSIHEFLNVMERAQAVRRMGSSALNLSYVAAGRLDAYWANDTKIWDVAAGWLLVREAGGLVTTPEGEEPDLARPRFVAAANSAVAHELSQLLIAAR